MELRQADYFLKLCEEKNITRASQALFISQQGLSSSIQNLEKELGLALFQKGRNGTFLTESGEKLKPYFEALIRDQERVISMAKVLREEPGYLVLGCNFPFMGTPCYDQIAHTLRDRREEVFWKEMSESELLAALTRGDLTLGFYGGNDLSDDFVVYQTVWKEQYVAVMLDTHRLSDEPEINGEDLRGEKIVLPPVGTGMAADIRRMLGEVDTESIFETANPMTMIPQILHENCVGIVPASFMRYIRIPALVQIPIADAPDFSIDLIGYRAYDLSSQAKAFVEMVQA